MTETRKWTPICLTKRDADHIGAVREMVDRLAGWPFTMIPAHMLHAPASGKPIEVKEET